MTFYKSQVEEVKPAKDKKEKKHKKEKKEKSKEKKEQVGEITDAAKLRAKLEKIDAKIDDLKKTKQEIVARLLELEETATNAAAAAPPASG
ncbi:hypothetical protein PR202_ga20862 [Eleusine coracana subsp. coracana]|uniref:KED-like protein n=1 Tax=Eleusine coracana subsp. coracana TaxID=191504 RepID=A0AAV5CXP7_ELECO|nr:hypothetical protein PR202_ga20862 [Eleusine coracana subsp. coracana]